MDYDESACLQLVGRVLHDGIQYQGAGYALTRDGRDWCELAGLRPQTVYDVAVRAGYNTAGFTPTRDGEPGQREAMDRVFKETFEKVDAQLIAAISKGKKVKP